MLSTLGVDMLVPWILALRLLCLLCKTVDSVVELLGEPILLKSIFFLIEDERRGVLEGKGTITEGILVTFSVNRISK